MDERPDLLQLMMFGKEKVNFIEVIGGNFNLFGLKLLEDKAGNKMNIIKYNEHGAEDIVTAVLKKWINGEGRKKITWKTLADVLDECGLTQLSEAIWEEKAAKGSLNLM